MSYSEARTAINQMVFDLIQSQSLENSTQWENTEFDPAGKALWASVEMVNDVPNMVTLGEGGYDRMVGYAMITYAARSDSGTKAVDDRIAEARVALYAGKSFTEGGTKVIITEVGPGPRSTVDSWYLCPLNIFYRTDLVRPSL